jgi:hypothetical protein
VSTREQLRSIRGNVYGSQGQAEVLDVPRCSVYRATAHNVGTGGTPNQISFDTLDYQSEGMWNPAAPTHITCLTAGVYLFTGQVVWPSNATNFRNLAFLKNGVTVYGDSYATPSAVTVTGQNTAAHIPLNAGDYVEMYAAQNTGGVLTLPANPRWQAASACLISTI